MKEDKTAILLDAAEQMRPMAYHFAKSGELCEPGDLLSAGYIAMAKAIEGWEPRPGIPFWAYAKPFVRTAMLGAIKAAQTPQLPSPPPMELFVSACPPGQNVLINEHLQALPELQRKVIGMRLLQSPRVAEGEASRALGISRSRLRRELWEAISALRASIKNETQKTTEL